MTESNTDPEFSVDFTFLESGNQLQTAFIGLHPALLVEPQVDEEGNKVTFVVTAVDLYPASLLELLELLREAAQEAHDQQLEMGLLDEPEVVTNYADNLPVDEELARVHQSEIDDEYFELAQLPETPEG